MLEVCWPHGCAGNGRMVETTQQGGNAMNTTTLTPATVKIHSGTTHYEVPPLDDSGEDYTQWSRMMKLVLRRRGLWDVVNGTSTAPSPTDAVAFKIWNNKDQEALLQITVALKKGAQNCVLDAETSKACWDTLASRYQAKDNQRTVFMLERLLMTPFSDAEPLEPQIDQLRLTARNLETARFAMAEKYLAGIIIMCLPESLSTLKTILANTDDAKLSVKGITNQVLADEAHRICTSGEHDATAFFAKAKPTSRRNKERQKDENRNNSSTSNSSSASGGSNGSKVCTHCKRRGHKITNCWMLKREKEEKEKANPAMMDSSKTTDMTAKASIARVS